MLSTYTAKKEAIEQRLSEFKEVSGDQLFYELCFCLLTPQSKARMADACIKILQEGSFLYEDMDVVSVLQSRIRFHNTKAKRLLEAKKSWAKIKNALDEEDSVTLRSWLIENINGFGLKEASHYLRNIGHEGLAILDRHTLKHLVELQVISEIPSLTTKRYLEIEEKFKAFGNEVGIPLDHLDLLMWSYETGEIFK